MDNEEKQGNGGVALGFVSFFSSIISIFVMYYIFAGISVVTGIIGLKNKNSRSISITSLIIVAITFIIKIIGVLLENNILSDTLTRGIF